MMKQHPPGGAHDESNERHVPVLFEEAMQFSSGAPGATVVDCTVGLAGHAAGIARLLGPEGHLIGFDRDRKRWIWQKARLDRGLRELGSQAPRLL
jgi:16S rRNA (cytosine1402-N4)-methyltransferase